MQLSCRMRDDTAQMTIALFVTTQRYGRAKFLLNFIRATLKVEGVIYKAARATILIMLATSEYRIRSLSFFLCTVAHSLRSKFRLSSNINVL